MKIRELSLLLLSIIISFASVLSVLFVPAFPEMAIGMGISSAQVQMTLSIFVVGYAISVLPYGPISNRFGRKPAIYLGASIATCGSLLVLIAGECSLFWLMIIGRFITALGSGVGLKVAFTMVGDVYQKEAATKKLSTLILAFAITPGLGIAIGGFLTQYLGWRSCFYFMAAYCLFVLALSFFLPETAKERDAAALDLRKIKEGLFGTFRNATVITCGLLMGCGASVIYLFAALGPFIGISLLGVSPNEYGLLNFIPPAGMIAGSFLGLFLAGKWEPLKVIALGISVIFIFSSAMLALSLMDTFNIWCLFLPMLFIYLGFSLVYSNASSMALSRAPDKSNASAVMHFCNLGTAVVMLFIVTALPFKQPFILPLVFLLLTVGMLALKRRLVHLLHSPVLAVNI
ncbi:MAG: MFS transporter [Parachlamydia sp.]|nr:MFS transporter [Parachlamydia sp.]